MPFDADSSIWNVGIIFYLLVTGRVPFEGKSFSEVIKMIKSTEKIFDPEARVHEDICLLIDTIFMFDQPLRVTLNDILSEDWFKAP